MSWMDVKTVIADIDFLSLPDDGAQATVVFMEEPVRRDTVFQGNPRVQIAFVVMTEAGPKVWTVAKKTARELHRRWGEVLHKPVLITRSGAAGSTDTSYTFANAAWTDALKRQHAGADVDFLSSLLNRVSKGADDTIPF